MLGPWLRKQPDCGKTTDLGCSLHLESGNWPAEWPHKQMLNAARGWGGGGKRYSQQVGKWAPKTWDVDVPVSHFTDGQMEALPG